MQNLQNNIKCVNMQIFTHFKEAIRNNSGQISSYLEIGPGHGLFFLAALEKLRFTKNFQIVDISKTSIEITESIVNLLSKNKKYMHYFVYGTNI